MFLLKKLIAAWLLPPFGLLIAAIALPLVGGRHRPSRGFSRGGVGTFERDTQLIRGR